MEPPSIQLHEAHQALIQQADRIVTESMNTVTKDPAHPIYHVTPAARFMNDPNGPVWHKGRYHLFFQHLPYWGDKSRPCSLLGACYQYRYGALASRTHRYHARS